MVMIYDAAFIAGIDENDDYHLMCVFDRILGSGKEETRQTMVFQRLTQPLSEWPGLAHCIIVAIICALIGFLIIIKLVLSC